MPDMELAFRTQKACLWAAAGVSDEGEPVRAAAPVELAVRWQTRRDEAGDPLTGVVGRDGTVVLDRDVAVGSVLWEGSLADLAALPAGTGPTPLLEVVSTTKTPDLKGRAVRRTAGLRRYKDVLPPTA
jgi:hypothetical protein